MANFDLLNRPLFWTRVSADHKLVTIGGTTDEKPVFRDYNRKLFGHLMEGAFPQLPQLNGMSPDQVATRIVEGELSFLFDENGDFINDHVGLSSS